MASLGRVLVVGAGGIGCELLKDLVASGFDDIDVIDLDTIDLSNLNRQFLFRREHIGRAKAIVACESVRAFRPSAHLRAHHENIKSPRFGVSFYRQFRLVLNALDNADARFHVNKMCVAARVPLVDSGTNGYTGQSTVILPGRTECYACQPKPAPTTYPVCTIRSVPEKPVHCVVWAKEAMKLLFSDPTSSVLFEELDSLYMPLVRAVGERDVAAAFLEAICGAEVEKQTSMGKYKSLSAPPRPLSDVASLALSEPSVPPSELSVYEKHSLADYVRLYLESFRSIRESFLSSRAPVEFDKGVRSHGDLVASLANVGLLPLLSPQIRAHVFRIPLETQFKIVEIAGNIIPAIATTNAIAAGLEVLAAKRLLSVGSLGRPPGQGAAPEDLTCTFIRRFPSRNGSVLTPVGYYTLQIDTEAAHLNGFLMAVVQEALHVPAPMISVGSVGLYDDDDPDPELLARSLSSLHILIPPPQPLSPLASPRLRAPGGGIHDGTEIEISSLESDERCVLFVQQRALSCFNLDEAPEGGCARRPRAGFLLEAHYQPAPRAEAPAAPDDPRDDDCGPPVAKRPRRDPEVVDLDAGAAAPAPAAPEGVVDLL